MKETSYLTDADSIAGSGTIAITIGNQLLHKLVAGGHPSFYGDAVKLCQGQVWKQGREYIRIVRLERLEVEYKSLTSLASREGTKHVTSKKDFCRLLKQARLLKRDKTPN